MPIKKSAIKALRQTKKRTATNKAVKETIKKLIKSGKKAIAAKKLDEAKALVPQIAKAVDKAAKRNIIHRNRAGRIKSDFTKLIKRAAAK